MPNKYEICSLLSLSPNSLLLRLICKWNSCDLLPLSPSVVYFTQRARHIAICTIVPADLTISPIFPSCLETQFLGLGSPWKALFTTIHCLLATIHARSTSSDGTGRWRKLAVVICIRACEACCCSTPLSYPWCSRMSHLLQLCVYNFSICSLTRHSTAQCCGCCSQFLQLRSW